MQFQVVRDAIITTLETDVAALPTSEQFRLIGYQRQGEDAETALVQSVEVFFGRGEFPKRGGSFVGDSVKHDCEFRVELTVAGKAKGKLDDLNNATTPGEVATALATFKEAASGIDLAMDQLFSNVWNILMDAKNETYNLPTGAVSSRWVEGFEKDQPSPKGEIVILTGNIRFSCEVDESVLGVTGTTGTEFDVTFEEINGDDEQQTGAAGTLGGS